MQNQNAPVLNLVRIAASRVSLYRLGLGLKITRTEYSNRVVTTYASCRDEQLGSKTTCDVAFELFPDGTHGVRRLNAADTVWEVTLASRWAAESREPAQWMAMQSCSA